MGNTFTNLLYHIIFSTKERLPIIDAGLRDELYKYIGGIIRGEKAILIEIGGMPDHLHLVVKFRADISISEMMRKIKAGSSKWINEQEGRKFKFSWQDGYGAFTVSESQLEQVVIYVSTQEDHHRKKTFQEEFLDFLKKQNIQYDEKYLWN